MNKLISFYNKHEYPIFILITVIASLHIFWYFVFHTLDGPQHLVTSNLIIGLLQNNPIIDSYFSFNPVLSFYIPTEFLLTLYQYFLPATIAHNLLIFTYIAGMAFSFRYMMIAISGRFSPVNYAIFPFIMNGSLSMGLFNFCFGLVLMFLLIGYWYRVRNNITAFKLAIITLLLIMMRFTHTLTFAFFGVLMLVLLVTEFFSNPDKKNIIIRYSKLLLVSVPAIVLLLLYVFSVSGKVGFEGDIWYDNVGLLKSFYYVRPLIIFSIGNDGTANLPLMILLVLLMLFNIVSYVLIRKGRELKYIPGSRFLLISIFVFVGLIIVVPPHYILYTMRDRLSLILFILVVSYLGSSKLPVKVEFVAGLLFLFMFTTHLVRMERYRQPYVEMARELKSVEERIAENSIIMPINASEHWMDHHMLNYIGSDKKLVNIKNPVAYGPFTIVWEEEDLPFTTLGGHPNTDINIYFKSAYTRDEIYDIDYVLIFRPDIMEKARNDDELLSFFEILDKHYMLDYTSPNRLVTVYKNLSQK